PAAQDIMLPLPRFPEERQFIEVTGHPTVADIPVSVAVRALPVVGIHGAAAAVGVRAYVEGVRPRIAQQHGEAVGVALPQHNVEAVIARIHVVGDGPDYAPAWIGAPRLNGSGAWVWRVVVVAAIQMNGARTEILHIQASPAPQRTRYIQTPLVGHRHGKVWP